MGFSVIPNVRKQAIKSNGCTSIYLRITIDRISANRATPLVINAASWSKKKQEVKASEPLAANINQTLQAIIHRIKKRAYELLEENKPITHEQLYSLISYSDLSKFKEFATKYIADSGNTDQRKSLLHNAVNLLEEFKPGLRISELNSELLDRFKIYLAKPMQRTTVKNGKEFKRVITLKHNTRVCNLARLRTIILAGVKAGTIKTNPFDNTSVGSYKSKMEFHSWYELQQIISAIPTLPKHQQRIINRYCFCCCSGFRFGDAEKLDYSMLRQSDRGYYFYISQSKLENTDHNDTVIVPLSRPALQFIDASKQQGRIFEQHSNQYINRELKKALKTIGIDRKITTHTARHTFITVTQERGGDRAKAGQIAGHRSERTTAGYSHYDLNTLFDTVQKWN